ncbi:hypothetical protein ACFQ2C_10065 [Sphingobacterium daejeonense]|uniref:Uncharacterized protein n=1 Tax=Sphingobacterium daejeonense TaxID=371142 RepID=A0ABW3RLI0_9SPHI
MESLKFEIGKVTLHQLNRVKDAMNDIANINDWQIAPYINGYLLSVEGINIASYSIISSITELGINAEQLYEE